MYMDTLIEFILQHAHHAHWYIFTGIVLAGINFPFSVDLLMMFGATLAATIVPDKLTHLYLSVFIGCLISAWLSYWFGRAVGPKMMQWRFFNKLLGPEKLEKIKKFYAKYGLWTLIVGRFIPFGVRNCIFMTTGMSHCSFRQFALRDSVACLIWTASCFPVYYLLGKNVEVLYNHVKTLNLVVLPIGAVALLGIIWYKKRKRSNNKKDV